jgi:hypothetical protein
VRHDVLVHRKELATADVPRLRRPGRMPRLPSGQEWGRRSRCDRLPSVSLAYFSMSPILLLHVASVSVSRRESLSTSVSDGIEMRSPWPPSTRVAADATPRRRWPRPPRAYDLMQRTPRSSGGSVGHWRDVLLRRWQEPQPHT